MSLFLSLLAWAWPLLAGIGAEAWGAACEAWGVFAHAAAAGWLVKELVWRKE